MPGESRLPRPVTIGGQAVIGGVMMRGPSSWAVAVRAPAGDVALRRFDLPVAAGRAGVRRVPVVRGVAELWGAVLIGVRALGVAAGLRLPEPARRDAGASSDARVAAAVVAVAIALFFVAPAVVARLTGAGVLVEGLLRIALLIGYLALLARRRSMRGVLAYHGAEHKAVACHEAGLPLTVERAAGRPRLHPRCGTSFVALVLIVAGVLLAPVGVPSDWPWLVLSRVLAAPLAAGVAFELVRWAVRAHAERLLAPLVQLQRLTTREPGREHLEVALAALGAVLPDAESAAGSRAGTEVLA
jgi:uncharacterized protein YqhQ